MMLNNNPIYIKYEGGKCFSFEHYNNIYIKN